MKIELIEAEKKTLIEARIADYRQGFSGITPTIRYLGVAVESIVAARVAEALRDAANEARIHAVSCPEPDRCTDRGLCAIHNETTADWLDGKADEYDPKDTA